MKTNKKLKVRLVFLYIGSFLISIAPLVVVFALNWGDYTKTPGDTVKLCFGGVFALFLIFLKVIGKLKMPRRIIFFGVVFLLAYLLQAVLADIILLSGMALAGEFVDLLCFQKPIKITKENIMIEKTSGATATKVEEVMKKFFNGRA